MDGEITSRGAADKAQIARAAGLVMLLFVASRALGLAREVVISHQFGTGAELDAYLAAFRVPDLIFQIMAGGALASAFIPTFASYLARGDEHGAWRLANAIVTLVLAVTGALSAAGAVLAPFLVSRLIAPGFSAGQQALTVQLMRLMLLTPAVFSVSGVAMGILNARQHFFLPALAPILYNLGIIAGAVALAPAMGVRGLAVGVVAGAAAHLAVQVPGLARHGMRYRPMLGLAEPGVREVGRLMLPRMAGLAAVQLNFVVNTILASGLAEGSLAALNYAWLLMLLPQGVFAQAVATAAFPTFSTQAARGQRAEMASTLAATLRAVLFLAVPAAVGLLVLRVPLIQMLFQRGEFRADSTQRVAWALAFYALGLGAHSVVEIVVRAFYALHDTKTPVAVGAAAMAANVVLSLAFIAVFQSAGWPAYGGLALSNSLATTAEMAALIAIIRRRLGGLEGRTTARALARIGGAAGVLGIVAWAFLRLLAGRPALLSGGAAGAAGAAAYAGVLLALGAPEMRAAWGLIRRGRAG